MHLLPAAAVAGVIPWIAAVPPAPVVPAVAPPCRRAALHVELELQGATGSLAGAAVFTNRGPKACSLLAAPSVRLRGGLDPAGVRSSKLRAESTQAGVPFPSLRALRPGQSAFLRLWWMNWCGASPTRLDVTVGGETFELPLRGSPRCDAPHGASTLASGPLQPRPPTPVASSQLPLAAVIVEQLRLGPKTVPGVRTRRGRTAVFHVALTNVSHRAFRFAGSCPWFAEGTGLGRPVELHLLNCRAVAAIRPGQRLVFEMRIRVPASVPLGRDPLTWTLAPASYEPPFAGGVLLVDP